MEDCTDVFVVDIDDVVSMVEVEFVREFVVEVSVVDVDGVFVTVVLTVEVSFKVVELVTNDEVETVRVDVIVETTLVVVLENTDVSGSILVDNVADRSVLVTE